MSSRLRGSYIGLVGLLVLLGAVFALVPSSSVVYAEKKDTWQCWRTGPADEGLFGSADDLEKAGWGPTYAYVLDPSDWETLRSDDYRIVDAEREYQHFAGAADEFSTFSPMASIPEYVDTAFALDYRQGEWDMDLGCRYSLLVERIGVTLGLDPCPSAEGAFFRAHGSDLVPPAPVPPANPSPPSFTPLTPWTEHGDGEVARRTLLNQRMVARPDRDRVRSFVASWANPDQPMGGSQWDQAAFLHDMMALQADLNVSTRMTAQEGNRRFSATATVPTITIQSSTTLTCGAGYPTANSCSSTTTTTSAPDSVNVHWQGVEQNNGEVFHISHAPLDNPAGVRDVLEDYTVRGADPASDILRAGGFEVYPHRQFGVSELHNRLAWERPGYSFMGQRSAESGDELHVTINVDPVHRGDFPWNFGDDFPNSVLLRGFGNDPWTMPAFENGWRFYHGAGSTNLPHQGYRQPVMALGFVDHTTVDEDFSDPHLRLIRWPTSFEDLSWFLYEVPDTLTRDTPAWLAVVDQEGGSGLVNSGFSTSTATDAVFAGCKYNDALYTREGIECGYSGLDDERFHPFHWKADPGVTPTFSQLRLVHAGIASPTDALSNETRRLDNFSFTIRDFETFPDVGVSQGSEVALRRYGVPQDPGLKASYVQNWPCGIDVDLSYCRPVGLDPDVGGPVASVVDAHYDLNPNRPYLLVVAYYESVNPNSVEESRRALTIRHTDPSRDREFSVPERRLRRVICRMLVLPAGLQPASDEGNPLVDGIKNAFSSGFQSLGNVTKGALDVASGSLTNIFSGWITNLFSSFGEGPGHVRDVGNRIACTGMEQLGNATDPEGGIYKPSVGVMGGMVVVNEVQQSRNEGYQSCQALNVHEPESCGVAAGTLVQEKCVTIPLFHSEIADVEFLDLRGDSSLYAFDGPTFPDGSDRYKFGTPPDVNRFYAPFAHTPPAVLSQAGLPKLDTSPGGSSVAVERRYLPFRTVLGTATDGLPQGYLPNDFNSGLARVKVSWRLRWPAEVTADDYSAISGFKLSFIPDPKVLPLPPGSSRDFWIPRHLSVAVGGDPAQTVPVDHIWLGALGVNGGPGVASYNRGSHPLHRAEDVGSSIDPGDSFSVAAVGTPAVEKYFEDLEDFVHTLPVAPGLVHKLEIRPYVGIMGRGDSSLEYGPATKVLIDGDEVFCEAERDGDGNLVDLRLLQLFDACHEPFDLAELNLYAPAAAGIEGFIQQVSLLNLTGTQTCSDFFTATPASLTWDNPIVRAGWSLMWVLAGAVMFSLIVWQGLRMTVDTWFDPRPALGLREFIPKALLAIILAVGSLYICQVVLILASDLTCMVAQATGVSMWGFWTEALSGPFNNMTEVSDEAKRMIGVGDVVDGLGALLKAIFMNFIIQTVILLWLLVIVFAFFKVVWGMLTRLALIAVLVVFSPVAFIFMASENTQHWTQKWISMFLGTCFQQVVVVLILYVGLYFAQGFIAGAEGVVFTKTLIATFLTLCILMLADRAAGLVNPGAKGLFDGLGSLLKMGMMATAAVAAVVIPPLAGAVMAGVGAFAGGGSAAAAGAVGGAATGAAAGTAGAAGQGVAAAATGVAPRAGGMLGNMSSLRGSRFFSSSSGAGSLTQGTGPSPSLGQRFSAGARAAGSSLRQGFSPGQVGRRFRQAQDFNSAVNSTLSGGGLTRGGRLSVHELDQREQSSAEAAEARAGSAEQEQQYRQQMLQQMRSLNQNFSSGSRRMNPRRRP